MASQKTIEVKVLNQKGVVYAGACQILFVPAKKEEVAILPYHTPLILLLQPGEVSVVVDGDRRKISTITGGIVYVGENTASVLITT